MLLIPQECETHLIAKFLLGVHTAGSSEGIIEQDESVALNIEGQVRASREDNDKDCFICNVVCPI